MNFKKKRFQKIYEAKSNISNTSINENEKIAHITQKATSKLESSTWIADIDASSHITNKFNLFSNPLTRIRRRTIKVEERELYTNQMRTIVLRSRKERFIDIKRVYYVSNLEANLLSCRRLCILKLKDRFDINFIYLHVNEKNMLKANHKERVYVLTWISSKFLIKSSLSSLRHQVFSTIEQFIISTSKIIKQSVATASKVKDVNKNIIDIEEKSYQA